MAGHKERSPGKAKKRAGKGFWRDKPIASHRIFSASVFGRPYLPLLVCCISVFVERDLRNHRVAAAGGGNAKSFAMMGGFLTRVSIMILGYAYPAYECYKTVELNRPEIEQLLFWCQYWILVAALAVFERVGDALISWLPLYGEFKLVFFVYLWHPKTKGTTYIYSTFFQPYMSRHENKIDRTLLELRTRANDLAAQYWQNILFNGRSWFLMILQYVVSQPSSTTVHPVEEPRHAHHASTASANETEPPLASQQLKTGQTNPVLSQKPEKVKTDSSPISPSSALSKPVQGPASTRSSTSSHHPPPPPPPPKKLIQENLATTNNHNSFPHSEETKQEEPIRAVRRPRIKKRVATTANSLH